MSDELDAAIARLLEDDGPDSPGITFDTLAESLLNQGPRCVHQDEDKHSDIQQEESAEQSH
jgi:hypothetical protein